MSVARFPLWNNCCFSLVLYPDDIVYSLVNVSSACLNPFTTLVLQLETWQLNFPVYWNWKYRALFSFILYVLVERKRVRVGRGFIPKEVGLTNILFFFFLNR